MPKPLSEMTLQELWQLFPIILTVHNEKWSEWFTMERLFLLNNLDFAKKSRINHIGSTAIEGIYAKPIIDILFEIPAGENMTLCKKKIVSCGYTCMSEEKNRISFNKGYTENGFAEKVFHLHLRFEGDNDELYFKNYLQKNAVVAKEYEKLKLGLLEKYKHNRDGYTEAKTEFIKKYTDISKKDSRQL